MDPSRYRWPMEIGARNAMNDTTFDALANEHRRRLLVAPLEENPQPANGQHPAGRKSGSGGQDGTHHVQVMMYHQHLPKLADHGFINWDTDDNEITKGDRFEEIRPLLEVIEEHQYALPDD